MRKETESQTKENLEKTQGSATCTQYGKYMEHVEVKKKQINYKLSTLTQ